MDDYATDIAKIPTTADLILILAIGFGLTGFSYYCSDLIAPFLAENYPWLEQFSLTSGFFWIVVIATAGGLVLSFTRLRTLEGAGSSRVATVLLYVLIASIGMQMDPYRRSGKPWSLCGGACLDIVPRTGHVHRGQAYSGTVLLYCGGQPG